MHQIPVNRLMTRDYLVVTKETPFAEMLDLLVAGGHSCALVVDESFAAGIITEKDLVRLMAGSPDKTPVPASECRDIMTAPVFSLYKEATLYEALVVSWTMKIRHIPVIDSDGSLCGLLRQGDLVKAHFRIIEDQTKIIEESVAERTEDLMKANRQLRALSMEDPLMQIGNRRAMEIDLSHTHSVAVRYGRGYSVALFDIDFFKKYNDHYGHLAGDDILKEISQFLMTAVRHADRLYRYGGEEILLLMPQTNPDEAVHLAQRILTQLESRQIEHEKSDLGVVTMSAGVATYECTENADETGWEGLLKLADNGLYQAKKQGRNQVCKGSRNEPE